MTVFALARLPRPGLLALYGRQCAAQRRPVYWPPYAAGMSREALVAAVLAMHRDNRKEPS